MAIVTTITQAIENTNITARAIVALSHHGPVAETWLVNRDRLTGSVFVALGLALESRRP